MYIGAHVSAAGGVFNSPKNAAEIGCEVLQMFSRPPQGGKPKPITDELKEKFQNAMNENNIKAAYIHSPYFINLASSKPRIYHASISILREELERGTLLGCKAMMFHPGSAKDVGEEKGAEMVIAALDKILNGYEGTCQLLIEISAGAGAIMGDRFEEVGSFINGSKYSDAIGVCFDTQHAFASGYDLRDQSGLNLVMKEFDKHIGLNKLVASHVNDSKVDLNEHKDRHENIGKGYIGEDAFKYFVQHKDLQNIDLILETPLNDNRAKEITLLKSFRSG